MGLLSNLFQLFRRETRRLRPSRPRQPIEGSRRCRFEAVESRRLLAANPLFVGAVYIEEDAGSDGHPDTFEVTFEGGAPGTVLTRLAIDGDHAPPGLSSGDLIFDTQLGGLGADQAYPFRVVALQDADPRAALRATVEDGSSLLVIDLSGFHAGDKLVFQIDVDEVNYLDPAATTPHQINDGVDPIASGVEFQASFFTASFSAPHYHDTAVQAKFRNAYDAQLAGTGLQLPADDEGGKRDRTAGAVGQTQQQPLPIAISGTVYLDPDLDITQESGEPGIPGVQLALWKREGDEYRFAGHTTTTDAHGDYLFDLSLNLEPGIYQIREAQPAGLFSVGARPGTVDGEPTVLTVYSDRDVLTDIAIPLGDQRAVDFDFAEAAPARISGFVYHDRDRDGQRDAGEEGISGVAVQVAPLHTIAAQGPLSVLTDASGFYEARGLVPGTYRIVETAQPKGYLDGLDTAGTVDGQARGTAENPGDRIDSILLGGGQAGSEYNFGELRPVAIRGHVRLTDADGNCFTAGAVERPVAGVTVRLLDSDNRTLTTTVTDAAGEYGFAGLPPGSYTVVETTPPQLIDGADRVGTVGGLSVGQVSGSDIITGIVLASGQTGIDYDFCEHEPASLAGRVYHDSNNDGVPQDGEEGLAAVRISLLDAAGHEVATTVTDAGGRYAFTRLSAGVYAIVETQPATWIDGLDRAGTVRGVVVGQATNPGDRLAGVRLGWGDEGRDYDFGELRYASLSGRVHLTTPDGDCYTTAGELPPLAGVTVRLQDAHGTTLAETTTDADGCYRFDNLLPGSYTVVELTPPGLIDGEDHVGTVDGKAVGEVAANDAIRGIALTSGQTAIDYDFCESEPASLSGYVYHDQNDNGVREAAETPLANVEVRLLDSTGQIHARTQTDQAGRYQFTDLRAGTYTLAESQPSGYLDGRDAAGTIDGRVVGTPVNPGDEIRAVQLQWGDQGQDYDFGELLTGSIEGFVHTDLNGDCWFDPEEAPLASVTIELLDDDGHVAATQQTDARGLFRFDGLRPGTYTLREQQPAGYFHGGQKAGSGGGDDSLDDIISAIALGSGRNLVDYMFCEVPPSCLSGVVFVDPNLNRRLDAGEAVLPGVTVRLLDKQGRVLATTHTDAAGGYRFEGLRPGTYAVSEEQPSQYFDGGQRAGSHGGNAGGKNSITAIPVPAGQELVNYDFWELPAGRLAGYVFQDGEPLVTPDGQPPANLREVRDGQQQAGDKPIAGVTLELRDGISGDALPGSVALPGLYGSGPIRTVTDQNGYYEFRGLPRGNYAVYEIQPAGYFDGLDTPGTTSGIAINPGEVSESVLQSLSTDPHDDAIVRIPLAPGGVSTDNNFSEVLVKPQPIVPPPEPPEPVPAPEPPIIVPFVPPPALLLAPPLAPRTTAMIVGGGAIDFTWHLSVIDSGQPRGERGTTPLEGLVLRPAAFAPPDGWAGQRMDQGRWLLRFSSDDPATPSRTREILFGLPGGFPVVGDFNGDGIDEIAVYVRGHWFIDLNGNGRWDEEDLWAQLGDEIDQPVTGDWNGDGKDDIGIYGPAWHGDRRALSAEPGLPDAENDAVALAKPKNVPPQPHQATNGVRVLQHTARGQARADVIDHVFRYGGDRGIAVTGDWTGDGIKNIGVFCNGRWTLDEDGDGRWTDRDPTFMFGQPGDIPVVGDFNGDGVDEIGVYRRGTWIIDLNGNRQIDAHDRVFECGGPGDIPVVGDWDANGVDDVGVYHDLGAAAELPTDKP